MSDESRKVTTQCFEKDFLNAKTPYDQWVTFQSVLNWANTSSKLAEELSAKNSHLYEIIKEKKEDVKP